METTINHQPETLVVAWDRKETDTCEAGTPGCCVDHNRCKSNCETW